MSFITNLPAADRYGKPYRGVAMSPPRLGTQVSDVVIKNGGVTKAIVAVSNPPIKPKRLLKIPNKVNEPF